MSKRGRSVTFHGAFKSKSKAIRKEQSVNGFIRKIRVRGHRRYVVMTRNS